MPTRITRRAKWPNQIQPFDIQRLVTPGEGFPEASYTGRNEEVRILCASI